MSDWKHKCSLDWLRSRQAYITASDIRKLIPLTSGGRAKTIKESDYISVMASKMVTLTDDDCWSYGAMARGHLLEPYAIKVANEIIKGLDPHSPEIYHWDDKLISLPNRKIAFSPDGLDIPMDADFTKVPPGVIMEVKCYNADRHLNTAYAPKGELEERWQIATAMALMPSIEKGWLVLFNPKMKFRKTFVIEYAKSDLSDEIDMILKVEKEWEDFCVNGPLVGKPTSGAVWSGIGGSEEQIVAEIRQRQALNP